MLIYLLMLIFIYIVSNLLQTYLEIRNKKFKKLEDNRKKYVVKNLVKSYLLFFYSIFGSFLLSCGYFYNIWFTNALHNMGLIYASIDGYGLLTVRNLPYSTIFHHSVVQILGFSHLYVVYPTDKLYINLLLLYTVCSAYSFMVNNYLGNRIILDNNNILLSKINYAYFSYIILCGINWLIHYYYLIINFNNLSFPLIAYYSLIHIIIYDDVNLIKFLHYNRNKLIRSLS